MERQDPLKGVHRRVVRFSPIASRQIRLVLPRIQLEDVIFGVGPWTNAAAAAATYKAAKVGEDL